MSSAISTRYAHIVDKWSDGAVVGKTFSKFDDNDKPCGGGDMASNSTQSQSFFFSGDYDIVRVGSLVLFCARYTGKCVLFLAELLGVGEA